MKIKKALITAGGYGTRFFPITKTIQKEMLPILSKPLLDYLVDDCINAGIQEIIFIIRKGDTVVKSYYAQNKNLHNYLKRNNKLDRYEEIAALHTKATFHFIEQSDKEYGTAVPVLLAKKHLKNEDHFLVLMGDDFIYHKDNQSEIVNMIQALEETKAQALMSCIQIPPEFTHKYGIVQTKIFESILLLDTIIEKPKLGTAPSNLANVSKYILSNTIFPIIQKLKPDISSGEYFLTDAIIALAKIESVAIHIPTGEYLDCGNVLGWLKTNIIFAHDQAEIWEPLNKFLEERFSKSVN